MFYFVSRPNQEGFSLLETIIVISIMALMLLFALPSYQTHLVKARVLEQLSLVQPIKQEISLALLTGDPMPDLTSMSRSKRFKHIHINTDGAIDISMPNTGNRGQLAHLILSPKFEDGLIQWDCTQGNLADDYRPRRCRHG